MVAQPDYFSNHRLKLRFPWRLYHDPIVRELDRVVRWSSGPDVLNVGSGPFFELERLDRQGKRFTVCDVDRRAIEFASRLYGGSLVRADVVAAEGPLPYPDQSFDLVVSMDVIEHVPEPVPWERRALSHDPELFVTLPQIHREHGARGGRPLAALQP